MNTEEKVTKFLNGYFSEAIPHNKALGLKAVKRLEDGLISSLVCKPEFVGNPRTGFLHGGVITSMLDATCGVGILIRLKKRTRIATLDLRIDYHRPAVAKGMIFCEARCYNVTRNVAFVRGVTYADDKDRPIASATGTFMIFRDSLFKLDEKDGKEEANEKGH